MTAPRCPAETLSEQPGAACRCDLPDGHRGAHTARVRLVWETVAWSDEGGHTAQVAA